MHAYHLRLKWGDGPKSKAFLVGYRMNPHFKNQNSNKRHGRGGVGLSRGEVALKARGCLEDTAKS